MRGFPLLALAGFPIHAEPHLIEFAQLVVDFASVCAQTLDESAQLLDYAAVLQLLLEFVLGPTQPHFFGEVEHSYKLEEVVAEVAALVLLAVEFGAHEIAEGTLEAVEKFVAAVDQNAVVVLQADIIPALENRT